MQMLGEELRAVLLRLTDPWDGWYGRLLAYVEEHGDALVPRKYKAADGAALGSWVSNQRTAYKAGKMSEARAARLEAVDGWMWVVSR